jgi:(p)ppGpp synthase/HD superfamily hydrolase
VLGCKNVPDEVERYITCRWETTANGDDLLMCQLEIRSLNRIGLVTEVVGAIAASRYNIAGMSMQAIEGTEETAQSFRVEVPDLFALANLIRKLERIPGVKWVKRTS